MVNNYISLETVFLYILLCICISFNLGQTTQFHSKTVYKSSSRHSNASVVENIITRENEKICFCCLF